MHMLQLGINQGTDAELKEHAKHMLADHEKMDTDMRAYARKYNIKLTGVTPNPKKINEQPGAEWDADWADEIADMHQKTVREFEKAQGLASEPELRNMIIAALPTLKVHLEMANGLRARLKDAAKNK
jgi:putative membrane protein